MFAAKFMCLLREISWGSTNVLLVFPMRKRSRKEVPSDFPRNPVRGVWEWFKAVPGDVWHETGHQETFYYQEVQKLEQTSLRSVPKACQSLRHLDNALMTCFNFWSALKVSGGRLHDPSRPLPAELFCSMHMNLS